jgi:hypothetical protein
MGRGLVTSLLAEYHAVDFPPRAVEKMPSQILRDFV